MLDEADTNQDGVIDMAEFCSIMKKYRDAAAAN